MRAGEGGGGGRGNGGGEGRGNGGGGGSGNGGGEGRGNGGGEGRGNGGGEGRWEWGGGGGGGGEESNVEKLIEANEIARMNDKTIDNQLNFWITLEEVLEPLKSTQKSKNSG